MIKALVSFFAKTPRPLDNMSPRVQKLFVLARNHADRLHQEYVGTEHLLLALLELKEGVGYTSLLRLKVDLEALQRSLDARVRCGDAVEIAPAIPCTPMFRKVMKKGSVEARALGHSYFGTEHVLLGMLKCRWGIAKSVLKEQGVLLDNLRAAVQEVLVPPEPQDDKSA